MRKFIVTLLGILFGIIGGVLLFEIALQIIMGPNLNTVEVYDNYITKKREPNIVGIFSKGWWFQLGNKVHINEQGFHSKNPYKKPLNNNSIAIIGDSLIESTLVESQKLFHPTLETKFKENGINATVYSLGISGAGLGDYTKYASYAKDKFGTTKFIIKIQNGDILDDIAQNPAHFFYKKENDTVKLSYKKQKYKLGSIDIKFPRYIAINLGLTPTSIFEKFKVKIFGKSKKAQNTTKEHNLDAKSNLILSKFLDDITLLAENKKDNLLFLVHGKTNLPFIIQKLEERKLEYILIHPMIKSTDIFYNDAHWNAKAINKISNAIVSKMMSKTNK